MSDKDFDKAFKGAAAAINAREAKREPLKPAPKKTTKKKTGG